MMDAQSVRTALGTLQNNSEADSAWLELREALRSDGGDLEQAEAVALLLAARERHEARGEADAVARLLDLTISVAPDQAEKVRLLAELSRVRIAALFDGAGAIDALRRAAELAPNDQGVAASLSELEARAAHFKEQVASYQAEAESAADDEYRSAMLMRACEAEVCFSSQPRFSVLAEDLEMAMRLDISNAPASRLLEVIYRRTGNVQGLVRVLERTADRAPDPQVRIAAGVRLARLFQHVEQDEEKAARVFDRVLESEPSHPDAISFVTDYYSKSEQWDALVKAFERQLRGTGSDRQRLGDMLQVAMLHWKMRAAMADAEPWFAKIRALEPAHEGMLAFYREYKRALGDDAGLAEVLESARATLAEHAPEREAIEQELSSHATAQADAHREIEDQKARLRDNPDDDQARERLKVLYKQTQGHNALVELLRQQLERTSEAELEGRVAVLRQIAAVYREYVKSDTALVGVLNQIVSLDGKLDEQDLGEVRELVALYDRLGRPRDLLASQKLLAEIVPDVSEKKLLYRQVGRRWLEQFSNVQHAMEAFAALHALDPTDEEAIERLEDLYRKRRAWKELFALYEQQLSGREGEARIPLLREMAQLAAERLSRVTDALTFYRQILDIDGSRSEVLDRFEKHAERAKDWTALADALERRLKIMPEDESRLPVLQKLGAVYADHLDRAEDAIFTWRRVVQVQPGNPRAMRVLRDAYLKAGRFGDLEALYVEQKDLEGLAEVLSTAADRAKESAVKIELSYRAARVYEEGLLQSARAIRSYERILSIDPNDVRAIDRLLPLYENDEKWGRVPPLLEVKLEAATSDEEKLKTYEQLVIVASQHLLDRRGAVAYARRAYQSFPREPRAVQLLDSTSRASGAWEEMVSALESRLQELGVDPVLLAAEARRLSTPPPVVKPGPDAAAASTPPAAKRRRRRRGKGQAGASQGPDRQGEDDSTAVPAGSGPSEAPVPSGLGLDDSAPDDVRRERRAVSLRLARILGEEMARADEAVARLKVLAQDRRESLAEEDAEVLSLLENLLRRQSRPEDIRWLFEHRAGRARDTAERVAILGEWAGFEERTANDRASAVRLQLQILELEQQSTVALETVVRLLLEEKDARGATTYLERLRDLSAGKERAEREVALAALYETGGRPEDALAAVQRALGSDVEPGRAISVLQRLVEVPAVRGEAARLLSTQYEAGGDARKEADALRALIAETGDSEERVELVLRLSAVYQQKLAEPGGALAVIIDGLRVRPTDMALWDRAEELAQLSGRTVELSDAYRDLVAEGLAPDVLVDLSRRAGRLHEEILGDAIGAVPYYEKVLSVEPDDDDAFIRLKEILTSAERWQELDNLYEREIARLDDGTRKMEMLAEVALLAEDITGDVRRAVEFHQRILVLEPDYGASVDALDRLYQRLGEKGKLLDLLQHRSEGLEAAERLGILIRIAHLALELHQPDRAMTAVESVLTEDLSNYDARELAEKLLEIGSVRVWAAKALENVYESRDEIRDLVRVLGVRLDVLRPTGEGATAIEGTEDERRELLRRIATLRDDRLHDDVGSFDVFAELVPLDPEDVELRDRLIDSGRRLSRPQRVVEVLLAAALAAPGAALICEILLQAAEIQLDSLEDSEAAEKTLRAVLEYRDEEPDGALVAARILETILSKAGRAEDLYQNLKLQTGLEPDGERKAELLARAAELAVSALGDVDGAIEAWESRLLDLPDDVEALQNLTELYEKAERYEDLKRVLVLRRDAAVDGPKRLSLIRHLADVEERHLGDSESAIASYRSILDEGGAEASTLRALIRLYEKVESFEDLAEALLQQADVVEDRSEELEALAQLGQVRVEKLGDIPGALDAYRRALGIDQGHEASLAALRALLSHEDPAARLDAASILEPIYEAAARAEDLYQVLMVQARATDDPSFKVELLRRASELAETALDDGDRAFAAAVDGLRAAAALGDAAEWMSRVDLLARKTGRFQEHAQVLEQLGPELFDAEQQLVAQKRVAALRRGVLEDLKGAIAAYEKALEIQPGDRDSLLALESIYEEQGEAALLLGVLERREESSLDEEERRTLAYRRAELIANGLQDADRAIEAYEGIIDLSLEPRAVGALEALYEKTERFDDWVALIQRQMDATPEQSSDLRVKLATVLLDRLAETERALDELERTLEGGTQHAAAIALLERIVRDVEDKGIRGRAAALLEPVYMRRADYDRVLSALEIRVVGTEAPDERRELIHRIAKLHEEQREDYLAALEVMARLVLEDPTDSSVVEELERLAKVAGAEQRLAELLEEAVLAVGVDDESVVHLAARAGEVFSRAGMDERALTLLRGALAFEPESDRLFHLVEHSLRRLDRPQELVELYESTLEHRFEPEVQLKLLHQIADLEKQRLGRPARAIEAHQRAVELDERNVRSLDELTVLLAREERFAELAELYLKRAELSAPREAAPYRLALAALYQNRLGQSEAALDQLEEIVRDLPENEQAIAQIDAFRQHDKLKARAVEILGPLFQRADDWRRLIRLNEDRFSLAEDPHERVQILRETAELWELRGENAERAVNVYAEALRLVPDDEACRVEFERLVEATGQFRMLAELYSTLLDEHADLVSRAELLEKLASVLDRRLDELRPALNRRLELLTIESDHSESIESALRLATLLGDWSALETALVLAADASLDPNHQVAQLLELGELRHLTLGNVAGAISAYERAFELDDRNPEVADRLIALHEESGDAARLAELYLARIENDDATDDLRYELNRRAARLFERELKDPHRAIECLSQALIAHPGDGETVVELNRLYRTLEMWPELLENLRLEAGTAPSAEKRLAIRHEIAQILADQLESHEEALEAYGIVLDEKPDDARGIEALFRLGRLEEHLARMATDLLVPALRQTNLKDQLVEALELRLTTEVDAAVRVETLRTLAALHEQDRGDVEGALAALLRAITELPESLGLYDEAERLAEKAGSFAKVADAFDKEAAAIFDAELAAGLFARIAAIREQRLGQVDKAVEAYQKATEQVGDRQDLLDALDRLYTEQGDTASVVALLERRMALADSDEAQSRILTRQGQLQLEKQKQPEEALGSLRQALERDANNQAASDLVKKFLSQPKFFEEAFEILDGVYRDRGAGSELAALHQLRVDRAGTPGERLEMRRALAEVLEHECRDALAAQRVLAEALIDAVEEASLQDDVERLAAITGAWSEAADALLLAAGRAKKGQRDIAADLCRRAVVIQRDRARDEPGAERALLLALEFLPSDEDLLEQLDELQRAAGREEELLRTVLRRAELAGPATRIDLLRRAGELAELTSNDEVAERVLREVIAEDPDERDALLALATLCEKQGNAQEAYELLMRLIELESDPEGRRALRVRAAGLARESLGKPLEATEILRAIFEENPEDPQVADSLLESYVSLERFDDLAEFLTRLIDDAKDRDRRAALQVRLAKVERERRGDVGAAVALLSRVFRDDPSHGEAATLLAEIHETAGEYTELAELLARQIEDAVARGEEASALALKRRYAVLLEERLQDLSGAAQVWLEIRGIQDSPEAAEALLRLFLALGETAQAAQVLEEICGQVRGQEEVERRFELARLYGGLGDRQAIVRVLGALTGRAATDAELNARLRAEYEQVGALRPIAELVLGEAERSTDVARQVVLYREAAGILLERLQDPETAAEVFKKAAELAPDNREILLELCDALSAAGKGDEAISALQKLVESYGGRRAKELGEIHRRLANAYLSQGQRDKALAELDQAFRIEPGNINVLRQLGDVAIDSGDLKKAQQMYRALLLQRLDQGSSVTKALVFYKLGRIHQLLSEAPKAKQMFERALQADPNFEEAKEALGSL